MNFYMFLKCCIPLILLFSQNSSAARKYLLPSELYFQLKTYIFFFFADIRTERQVDISPAIPWVEMGTKYGMLGK